MSNVTICIYGISNVPRDELGFAEKELITRNIENFSWYTKGLEFPVQTIPKDELLEFHCNGYRLVEYEIGYQNIQEVINYIKNAMETINFCFDNYRLTIYFQADDTEQVFVDIINNEIRHVEEIKPGETIWTRSDKYIHFV